MLKERLLPISIFSLAFAIIVSAFIISKGMKNNGEYLSSGLGSVSGNLNNMSNSSYYDNEVLSDNLTLSEVADYLGLTQSQILELTILNEDGLPYLKVGSRYIFNKNAIINWLETARVILD